MFPDEAMATALVVGVRCDILRDDVDQSRSFLVMFDRSYAEYVVGALGKVLRGVRVGAPRAGAASTRLLRQLASHRSTSLRLALIHSAA